VTVTGIDAVGFAAGKIRDEADEAASALETVREANGPALVTEALQEADGPTSVAGTLGEAILPASVGELESGTTAAVRVASRSTVVPVVPRSLAAAVAGRGAGAWSENGASLEAGSPHEKGFDVQTLNGADHWKGHTGRKSGSQRDIDSLKEGAAMLVPVSRPPTWRETLP
jgi:hypothetical protein